MMEAWKQQQPQAWPVPPTTTTQGGKHQQQPPSVMIPPQGVTMPSRNQTYDQAVESPTLSSTFLSPVLMTAPSSNSSGSTECSTSALSLTSNFSNSPPHHGISSPSAMIPFLAQQQHHVVCSPSPVVSLDTASLQSAWVAPSNFMASPMAWVASPTNFVQPLFHHSPTAAAAAGGLPFPMPGGPQQHAHAPATNKNLLNHAKTTTTAAKFTNNPPNNANF